MNTLINSTFTDNIYSSNITNFNPKSIYDNLIIERDIFIADDGSCFLCEEDVVRFIENRVDSNGLSIKLGDLLLESYTYDGFKIKSLVVYDRPWKDLSAKIPFDCKYTIVPLESRDDLIKQIREDGYEQLKTFKLGPVVRLSFRKCIAAQEIPEDILVSNLEF